MATTTYEPIATQTLSSSAGSVTFTSIPQTYTDLIVVGNYYVTGPTNRLSLIQVGNGSIDTGSNYSVTYLGGSSSSPFSGRGSNTTEIYGPNHSGDWATGILHIQNYSSTSAYKTILTRGGSTGGNTGTSVGLWRNTAAINQVLWMPNGDNFAAGSTFTIYGIANAAVGAPKATGGIITYDDTYFYHTFGASGTFTPQQNLTNVDYLVIAGGGSGGGPIGYSGGGGAGGLRSTVDATGGGGTVESKISLNSGTAYTVTVGAGGSPGSGGTNSSIAGTGLTTITSVGGGCAGYYNGSVYISATSGGSGGGGNASGAGSTGGAGTSNQGYKGGDTGSSAAGGGGGAASVGANGASMVAGVGGSALTLSTFASVTGTGVSNKYAGGGGAIVNSQNVQSVGGGGGAGDGNYAGTGVSATANTGSGGGGGSSNGGSGGSGIVIIRYPKA